MMRKLQHQWQIWLIALGFFTRIPVPSDLPFNSDNLNRASRFFSLVGLLVGAISAAVFWISAQLFGPQLAVLLAMAASLLLTGAFHEDGLADVWDGFGGGWSVEQKLTIMKDSRIGTYGACALVITLLTKFAALSALANPVLALILGHTLSRALASSLIFDQPYVRDIDSSKVKPLANQQKMVDLLLLLAIAGLPLAALLWLASWQLALLLTAVLLVCRALLVGWFRRQIGGYTGDCLGAAQQLSEIAVYLVMLLWQLHAHVWLEGRPL